MLNEERRDSGAKTKQPGAGDSGADLYGHRPYNPNEDSGLNRALGRPKPSKDQQFLGVDPSSSTLTAAPGRSALYHTRTLFTREHTKLIRSQESPEITLRSHHVELLKYLGVDPHLTDNKVALQNHELAKELLCNMVAHFLRWKDKGSNIQTAINFPPAAESVRQAPLSLTSVHCVLVTRLPQQFGFHLDQLAFRHTFSPFQLSTRGLEQDGVQGSFTPNAAEERLRLKVVENLAERHATNEIILSETNPSPYENTPLSLPAMLRLAARLDSIVQKSTHPNNSQPRVTIATAPGQRLRFGASMEQLTAFFNGSAKLQSELPADVNERAGLLERAGRLFGDRRVFKNRVAVDFGVLRASELEPSAENQPKRLDRGSLEADHKAAGKAIVALERAFGTRMSRKTISMNPAPGQQLDDDKLSASLEKVCTQLAHIRNNLERKVGDRRIAPETAEANLAVLLNTPIFLDTPRGFTGKQKDFPPKAFEAWKAVVAAHRDLIADFGDRYPASVLMVRNERGIYSALVPKPAPEPPPRKEEGVPFLSRVGSAVLGAASGLARGARSFVAAAWSV